jgi:hypothetical protein
LMRPSMFQGRIMSIIGIRTKQAETMSLFSFLSLHHIPGGYTLMGG